MGLLVEQFSSFFIYKAKTSRGACEYRFAALPVQVVANSQHDTLALENYAKALAQRDSEQFVGIIRSKIFKKQLVEMGGERFLLTGFREWRNGRQLAFSVDEIRIILRLLDQKENIAKQEAYDFVQTLMEKAKKVAPTLSDRLALENVLNGIEAYENELIGEEVKKALLEIILIINAEKNAIDLSYFYETGGTALGCLQLSFTNALNKKGLTFIDQSVTGMFENRQYIGPKK